MKATYSRSMTGGECHASDVSQSLSLVEPYTPAVAECRSIIIKVWRHRLIIDGIAHFWMTLTKKQFKYWRFITFITLSLLATENAYRQHMNVCISRTRARELFLNPEGVPNGYDDCSSCSSCCACCYRFRKMPKALLIRNGMLRNYRSTVLDF